MPALEEIAENDVITLSNETMIKACEEEMSKRYNLDYWRFAEEQGKLRYALNSYKDVKIDEVVASNSGPTYEVTVEIEICGKLGISSSWDCAFYSIEDGNELILYFTLGSPISSSRCLELYLFLSISPNRISHQL